MPTGYGYVRDSEPLAVDWAAVSKKFTDQLKSQEDERLATKKEILDNRADFQKTLLDRPVGQNTALNNIMSGFANQLSEYSLSNLNQYKGKNKNLQEYNAWENNARSGTELLFDAVESFNKNFDGYAQRAQDGSASQIEVFMHELTQDFTDFGKVSVDVDQKTGEVIISELGEDGKPTGKTLDVSQLGYFSRFTRDKYDINGAIGAVAQNLGTKFLKDSEGRSLQYQGQLYDEIVNNEELMKGLDTEISALIDEGFELESVLADSMNYKIVTDKTDEENKLFFNQDTNQFEITESQKQAAFDHVKQKLMNALNIDRREPAAKEPESLDPQRVYEQYLSTLRLINQSGKQIPKYLIDLALASIPGVDPKQFEDLTFEDAPVKETASERKARLKRERDNVIVKKSNTWYENEFLTDIQEGERYSNDDLRQLLLNTPYVIDKNGKVTFGSSEVYNFNTTGRVDFEDVVEFKKKLKAVLDPNQEVFLYYTANPDQMTGGSDGIDDYSNY